MSNPSYHLDTLCIQGGYEPASGEPRIVPIAQSTTFKYDSAEQVGDLFDLRTPGFFYTRLANPTVAAVEAKIAALEGGAGALCTASGQAAISYAILNICQAGDHLVASSALYGGTLNLFAVSLKKMGIAVTFVAPDAPDDELQAAIRPETKCIFGETIANPALRVLDLARVAGVAHRNGLPLIVDNTFATPALCRPLDFGADLVVHSTSKYLDGHACALGGVIVDGGRFDWVASGRFPGLTQPDDSYHGLVYCEAFGPLAYIVKARVQLMRDLGAAASPMNAFLLNLGLETLPLRMARHSSNALAVARHLAGHAKVGWVNYPGLDGHADHALVQRYLPAGQSGVVAFGVRGGREAAMRFMNRLRLAAIVVHVADARTSVLHPASTTHRQLNDEQLAACGIGPDMIRFSVGIEHAGDILADLDQALAGD